VPPPASSISPASAPCAAKRKANATLRARTIIDGVSSTDTGPPLAPVSSTRVFGCIIASAFAQACAAAAACRRAGLPIFGRAQPTRRAGPHHQVAGGHEAGLGYLLDIRPLPVDADDETFQVEGARIVRDAKFVEGVHFRSDVQPELRPKDSLAWRIVSKRDEPRLAGVLFKL